jgi:hypothetical protein
MCHFKYKVVVIKIMIKGGGGRRTCHCHQLVLAIVICTYFALTLLGCI